MTDAERRQRVEPINPSRDCLGCEDDFYNGKNPYGIQQCWLVKTAKIVDVKSLSVDQPTPEEYLKKAKWEKHPQCYQRKRVLYIRRVPVKDD